MKKAIVKVNKHYLSDVIPLPEGASISHIESTDNPYVLDFIIEYPGFPDVKNDDEMDEYTIQVRINEDGSLTSTFIEAK